MVSLANDEHSQSSESVNNRLKMVALPKFPKPIAMRADPDLNFLTDSHLKEKKQWKLMMDYFKKNPNALMDAIPTPPNEKAEAQGMQ